MRRVGASVDTSDIPLLARVLRPTSVERSVEFWMVRFDPVQRDALGDIKLRKAEVVPVDELVQGRRLARVAAPTTDQARHGVALPALSVNSALFQRERQLLLHGYHFLRLSHGCSVALRT